jgi:hypothetical protein
VKKRLMANSIAGAKAQSYENLQTVTMNNFELHRGDVFTRRLGLMSDE